jgi:hypothetical protein
MYTRRRRPLSSPDAFKTVLYPVGSSAGDSGGSPNIEIEGIGIEWKSGDVYDK